MLSRVVARTDVDQLLARLVDELAQMPAYRRFVGEPDELDDRGRIATRWNIQLFLRWLVEDRPPTEAELARLRELVRTRAAEGRPMEEGLLVYRQGMRAGWDALFELAADEEERAALFAAIDVFFGYVSVITDAFAAAYAANEARDDQQARALLDVLIARAPLDAEAREAVEQLALPLAGPWSPFVAALAGGSARAHAALAGRLRGQGVLAVSEGNQVAGLAAAPVRWERPGQAQALLAAAEDPVAPEEAGRALDRLRAVCRIAARAGRRGVVRPGQYLPEVLLHESPHTARVLANEVYGPLDGNPDLARTLQALVEHNFDKTAAAAALPVHRNTLVYRAARIQELTGLDLSTADDRGRAWLATLQRDHN